MTKSTDRLRECVTRGEGVQKPQVCLTSFMDGSVAPDPDSNLNSSLISKPDSGKLGSGKILCYQALDLIQVDDLIQVKKNLNQADIMLPKLAGQQVSILIHMYCDKCKRAETVLGLNCLKFSLIASTSLNFSAKVIQECQIQVRKMWIIHQK